MANTKTVGVTFELQGGYSLANDLNWLRTNPTAQITFEPKNLQDLKKDVDLVFGNVLVGIDKKSLSPAVASFGQELERVVTTALQNAVDAMTKTLSAKLSQISLPTPSVPTSAPRSAPSSTPRAPSQTAEERAVTRVANTAIKQGVPLGSLYSSSQLIPAATIKQNEIISSPEFQAKAQIRGQKIIEDFNKLQGGEVLSYLGGGGPIFGGGDRARSRYRQEQIRKLVQQNPNVPDLEQALHYQDATNRPKIAPNLNNFKDFKTLQQIGFGAIFGATAGGGLGGVVGLGASAAGAAFGGGPGALLASTVTQTASVLANALLEPFKAKEEEFKQAGESFAHSILSITAVLQNSFQTTSTSPAGIASDLKSREAEATRIQQSARSKILPLGVGGEAESTLVSSVVSGLSQRGLKGNAEQIGTIAQRIAAVVQAQQPEFFNNTTRSRKDIESLLNGSGRASSLTGLLGAQAVSGIRRGATVEDIEKATSGLQGFVGAVKESDNVAALLNKKTGAEENLKVAGGNAYFEQLKPALEDFIKTLQDPQVLKASELLGTALGKVAAISLELTAGFTKLGAAVTSAIVDFGKKAGQAGQVGVESGKDIVSNIKAGFSSPVDLGIGGFFKTVTAGFAQVADEPAFKSFMKGVKEFGESAKDIVKTTGSGFSQAFVPVAQAAKAAAPAASNEKLRYAPILQNALEQVGLDKVGDFTAGTESPEAQLAQLKYARSLAVSPNAEAGVREQYLPGIANKTFSTQEAVTKNQVNFLKDIGDFQGAAKEIGAAGKTLQQSTDDQVSEIDKKIKGLATGPQTPETLAANEATRARLNADRENALREQTKSGKTAVDLLQQVSAAGEKSGLASFNTQSLFGTQAANALSLQSISQERSNLLQIGAPTALEQQRLGELGVREQQVQSSNRQNSFDITITQSEYNQKLRESGELMSQESQKRRDLTATIAENRNALDQFGQKLRADSASKEEQFIQAAKEARAAGVAGVQEFTPEQEKEARKNVAAANYNKIAFETGNRQVGESNGLGLIKGTSPFFQKEEAERQQLESNAKKLDVALKDLPDVIAEGNAKVGKELDALAARLNRSFDVNEKAHESRGPLSPEESKLRAAQTARYEEGQKQLQGVKADLAEKQRYFESGTEKAINEKLGKGESDLEFKNLGPPLPKPIIAPELRPGTRGATPEEVWQIHNTIAGGDKNGNQGSGGSDTTAASSVAAVQQATKDFKSEVNRATAAVEQLRNSGISVDINANQIAQIISDVLNLVS